MNILKLEIIYYDATNISFNWQLMAEELFFGN
jgi:hypothetical protein